MAISATLRIRDPRWPRIGIAIITLFVLAIGVHAVWTILDAAIDAGKRLGYLSIALGWVAYYLWFEWLMWWPDFHRDWHLEVSEAGLVIHAPDLFWQPEVLPWSHIEGFLADTSDQGRPGPVRTLWAKSNWGGELAVLPIGAMGNLLVLPKGRFVLQNGRLRTRWYCGREVRGLLADVEDPESSARLLREQGISQLDAVEKSALKKNRREKLRSWRLFLVVIPGLAGLFGIVMILGELD